MKRQRQEEASSLKPIGAALAAVVAGLGPAKAEAQAEPPPRAPLEPAVQGKTYFVDHTNHPSFEEDPSMVVGESAPAPVLGGQRDLFRR
ncbi:MAG: hypothetical protein AB7P07_03035 [Hyphomonadaceae bacterium]